MKRWMTPQNSRKGPKGVEPVFCQYVLTYRTRERSRRVRVCVCERETQKGTERESVRACVWPTDVVVDKAFGFVR